MWASSVVSALFNLPSWMDRESESVPRGFCGVLLVDWGMDGWIDGTGGGGKGGEGYVE